MVKKRKKPARKHRSKKTFAKILQQDFRKHLLYTFFILVLSSFFTVLISSVITGNFASLSAFFAKAQEKENSKESYKETGSPYDEKIANQDNPEIIFHGDRSKKQIALTFDAEMTYGMKGAFLSKQVQSSYDPKIIEILNSTNTEATLFLTGMWIELYQKETEEFSNNPLFELGSHSYTDSSFSGECYGLKKLTEAEKIEEIGTTERLLKQYGHIDNVLFRFPGGCYAPNDIALMHQAGDMVVHWDVAGEDGFNNNTESIVRNVVDKTQNGSIIVLHMNGAPTAPKTSEALPEIISQLKEKGFEFVKVSELLGLPEEQQVQ